LAIAAFCFFAIAANIKKHGSFASWCKEAYENQGKQATAYPDNPRLKEKARQVLWEFDSLINKVSTTKVPIDFFDGYDEAIEKLHLLISIEHQVNFTGEKPSKVLEMVKGFREKDTREFIEKWHRDAQKEIYRADDERGKVKAFHRNFDAIAMHYPQMSQANVELVESLKAECQEGIGIHDTKDSPPLSVPGLDGVEDGFQFERYIAQILAKNGYTAQATQKSGDYGTDVLAEKDGIKYAVQCKLYSQPVGVKSVQEALSGKQYYNCHIAVVVTNNSFTRAAIELAEKTGVLLWNGTKIAGMSGK